MAPRKTHKIRTGVPARRKRCASCHRLGYPAVAMARGGKCHMCGGNFFTTLLNAIPHAINAIARWKPSSSNTGVTSFSAATNNRNGYKHVNPLSYTHHYNAY
jgi:hypothetical protein